MPNLAASGAARPFRTRPQLLSSTYPRNAAKSSHERPRAVGLAGRGGLGCCDTYRDREACGRAGCSALGGHSTNFLDGSSDSPGVEADALDNGAHPMASERGGAASLRHTYGDVVREEHSRRPYPPFLGLLVANWLSCPLVRVRSVHVR